MGRTRSRERPVERSLRSRPDLRAGATVDTGPDRSVSPRRHRIRARGSRGFVGTGRRALAGRGGLGRCRRRTGARGARCADEVASQRRTRLVDAMRNGVRQGPRPGPGVLRALPKLRSDDRDASDRRGRRDGRATVRVGVQPRAETRCPARQGSGARLRGRCHERSLDRAGGLVPRDGLVVVVAADRRGAIRGDEPRAGRSGRRGRTTAGAVRSDHRAERQHESPHEVSVGPRLPARARRQADGSDRADTTGHRRCACVERPRRIADLRRQPRRSVRSRRSSRRCRDTFGSGQPASRGIRRQPQCHRRRRRRECRCAFPRRGSVRRCHRNARTKHRDLRRDAAPQLRCGRLFASGPCLPPDGPAAAGAQYAEADRCGGRIDVRPTVEASLHRRTYRASAGRADRRIDRRLPRGAGEAGGPSRSLHRAARSRPDAVGERNGDCVQCDPEGRAGDRPRRHCAARSPLRYRGDAAWR